EKRVSNPSLHGSNSWPLSLPPSGVGLARCRHPRIHRRLLFSFLRSKGRALKVRRRRCRLYHCCSDDHSAEPRAPPASSSLPLSFSLSRIGFQPVRLQMPESGLESGDLWGDSPPFTTGATVFVSSPSSQGFNPEISSHRRRGNPNSFLALSLSSRQHPWTPLRHAVRPRPSAFYFWLPFECPTTEIVCCFLALRPLSSLFWGVWFFESGRSLCVCVNAVVITIVVVRSTCRCCVVEQGLSQPRGSGNPIRQG
ncbi:hypothetical protein V6N11_037719, partial [Hibiscus sabdariffa]